MQLFSVDATIFLNYFFYFFAPKNMKKNALKSCS